MKGVASAVAVGAVILVSATTSYLVAPTPGFAASQTITAAPTVGVIIPPSGSATSTASPSPSATSTTGGGTTGGSGGGSPVEPIELPTKSDGGPIPPSEPTEDADGLDLDRESVTADEWIIATGTGFSPGEKVQFVLYPGAIIIGSFVADAGGTVVARFKITEDARPGTYVVEATGWASTRVLNDEFRVVAVSDAEVFPFLWWVLVVIGVLLAAFLAVGIYFRHTIRSWIATPVARSAP